MRYISVLALLLPLTGFVCDGAHYPMIQNNLGVPVEITEAYSNGQSFSGSFPPGAQLSSPHVEGLQLTYLEVLSEGKVIFHLEADDLKRLRANIAPGHKIVWSIERDGVRAMPKK